MSYTTEYVLLFWFVFQRDGSDEFEYDPVKETELGMRCQFNRDVPIDKVCHLPDRYICDHELDCVGGKTRKQITKFLFLLLPDQDFA